MAETSGVSTEATSGSSTDSRLFMLAFDHRKSLRPLFGIESDPSPEDRERIAQAKLLIFESLLTAKDRMPAGARAGLLTDEETGAEVLLRAREHDDVVASVAVERSGQKEFQFEYGDEYRAHIERFEPEYVKALVRYNPGGDADLNRRQIERLRELSGWLSDQSSDLLFELLVPAEPEQIESVDGDQARYDRDIRPGLVRQAIEQLQDGGVRSRTWKIEGLETAEDCRMVAEAVRRGDPDANCLILGRGADQAKVEHWLEVAAPVPGFEGFAVGRTIWWDTVAEHLAGRLTREEAIDTIAARYLHFVGSYLASAGSPG